jgi:hypothetical protein
LEPQVPWFFLSWMVGASALVVGVVVYGVRSLTRRPKRRVTFALPKELDFEG